MLLAGKHVCVAVLCQRACGVEIHEAEGNHDKVKLLREESSFHRYSLLVGNDWLWNTCGGSWFRNSGSALSRNFAYGERPFGAKDRAQRKVLRFHFGRSLF